MEARGYAHPVGHSGHTRFENPRTWSCPGPNLRRIRRDTLVTLPLKNDDHEPEFRAIRGMVDRGSQFAEFIYMSYTISTCNIFWCQKEPHDVGVTKLGLRGPVMVVWGRRAKVGIRSN
jgi:hypothetical protein